jgi:hypothetical protein
LPKLDLVALTLSPPEFRVPLPILWVHEVVVFVSIFFVDGLCCE